MSPKRSGPNSRSSTCCLLPWPPTSCQTSSMYQSPVAKNPSLAALEDSEDSPSSQAWTDCPRTCEIAKDRDKDRLGQDYDMGVFAFHLSLIRQSQKIEEYIVSYRSTRFFIWSPIKGELQYIRTPWSLKGLHLALNSEEQLQTQLVQKWKDTTPGVQDILPCPPAPKDWVRDHGNLLAPMSLRDWDLHHPQPILFYDSYSGDEDAHFFKSDGSFYLYFPFHGFVYELPEMKDDFPNLKTLGTVPGSEGPHLKKCGPAEFFGGRRVLDQAAIPRGWTQLPWNPDQQVTVLPPRCRYRNTQNILTSYDGKTQLIECEDEYFMWFVPEKRVSQIVAPLGLEGILRNLRLNSKCHFVKE